MHDLIEDCKEWSLERLKEEGFSERTLELVAMLTHDPDVSYMDYIINISQDPDATIIKMADLEHNSLINRTVGLRPKDFMRNMKYTVAYTFLKEVRFAENQLEADKMAADMKANYHELCEEVSPSRGRTNVINMTPPNVSDA